MTTVYHVTPNYNLTSIRKHGLIPQLGPNASELDETRPAVWLFPTKEDAENAVNSWLGDQFGYDTPASLLTIQIPEGLIKNSDVDYERICLQSIPASNIKKIEPIW